MKMCVQSGLAALLLCMLAVPAWAENGAALDEVTMEVVDDPDADEREYVDEIRLPSDAAPVARDSASFGIDTANGARERAREEGKAFGQSTAEEARELGREAGNAARSRDGTDKGPPEDLPVQVR